MLRHTCKGLHPVSSPEAAEMVKLYENTFRALNIALSFEIAEACRDHGLDPIEVTEAAASKPYGFMAHYPSAGVGGHCIGVDPHYLPHPLRERGRPASLVEEAMRKLAGRPGHVRGAPTKCSSRWAAALRGARASSSASPTSPASPTAARRRRSRSSPGCGPRARRSTTTTRSSARA